MTSSPFNPAGVSSLTEVLAKEVGTVTFVPAADLSLWLPDLLVPSGWETNNAQGQLVTRMLLRRVRGDTHWDACEVINLYRVAGAIPETLVAAHVDRTLRDAHAAAVQTQRIDVKTQCEVFAARATGLLPLRSDTVHVQYTDYAVNTPAGGALIEQTILVINDVHTALSNDSATLADDLETALVKSIDRASGLAHPDDTIAKTRDPAPDPRKVTTWQMSSADDRWAKP